MDIIAEIGQAHDGSLGIAHSYIDSLCNVGVNAVKFQMHIAEAESSDYENFRTNFSYEDNSRFEYWKRIEFTFEQWVELKKHCDDVGLEFLASPFSIAAVNLLEKLKVSRYKIGSGEVTNLLMLESIALTKKPILLSSGLSSFNELDDAVANLNSLNCSFSILQCTTAYPTSPEKWGLNVISQLRERYNVPIGFSDHSGDIYACLAAVALSASIIEFHVVFDKRMFGPDSKSSLTIDEAKKMVRGINEINNAINNPVDKTSVSELYSLKGMFEKSLAVNHNLKAGAIISVDDLESKKPKGLGIPASQFRNILGKRIKRDMTKWSFINYEDILDEKDT